jgi:hypothetical protein
LHSDRDEVASATEKEAWPSQGNEVASATEKRLVKSADADHKRRTIGAFPMTRIASRLASTAAALVMLAGAALAQQSPTPQASPSHLAAAREVAIGSGMVRSFDAMTEPLLASLQQMNVTRPEIKQDLDKVVEQLRPELEQQKQHMINASARIFASRMSEQELRDIANFFKSPAGLKYVQTQPIILDDIVKELADWTRTMSEYVMVRARAEMSKRGHQLQ